MITFETKNAKEIKAMSLSEKTKYYSDYKAYILSLPFDEEKAKADEKRYFKTRDSIVSKYSKLEPNFIGKKYEQLPECFVVASNHLGSLDYKLLVCAFPDVSFNYMIKNTLLTWKNFYVGYYYLRRGAFVVDPKSADVGNAAEVASLQYLFRDKNVVILPEGTRTIKYGSDGTVQRFKSGIIRIVQIAGVPIIPVAINNNFEKGKLFINVGDEFNVSYDDSVHEKTTELREKIVELWQENKEAGAEFVLSKKYYTKVNNEYVRKEN